MKKERLEGLFDFLPKSKVKAGEGLEEGKYPFYTSSENQAKYLDKYQYEPGCLVFGTGGKASVHFTTSPFATSTDCITIKSKPKVKIDAGYVFQYLKGNMQVLENGFKGAGLKHISKAYLSEIQIPHPEALDDQIRIAHLLGKVEGLIVQRKQHLQQLDELLKSVFLYMFGDPIRNDKKWDTSSIESMCSAVIDCPHSTPVYTNEKTGYFCIRSSDIVNGYLVLDVTYQVEKYVYEHRITRYTPQTNDIVYSREGGRLGNAARIIGTDPICLGQRMMLFSVKQENRSEFLWALLESEQFKSKLQGLVGGGAAPRVNIKDLKKIDVIKPPENLQDLFSQVVLKIDGLRDRYQKSLTELKNLYGALSQKAFKGELDLSRIPLPPNSLTECENAQYEVVSPVKSAVPDSINIALESLNAFNEQATSLKDIARAARASSLIDSKQFDIVKQAAAQLAANHSPVEQLRNMSGIASAMEQLESTIKPLNLSQYDSIAKTAELARSMASSISKIDLDWLEQQRSAALKYATAPFESMRSAMEKIESLNYRQAESIAKSIGLANSLRLPDLHDEVLRNSASVHSSIAGLESLQREQLESAKRAQSALDYSKIAPKFDTSLSKLYQDAQKATFDPLADIRNAMGSTTSAYTQYLASNSLVNYFANEEGYDRPLFYAEDILDILSNVTEPLSFESLMDQLNELATVDFVGYESIKTILFDLLAENQIKQTFDPENQILLFSIVQNGSEQ